MIIALSDNATAVVLALIGLVGVIVPVSITAWVGLKLHHLAPQVAASTEAVARMEPQVATVVQEVVDPESPAAKPNLASKVTAIDAAVNNRLPQDLTLRETAEATGAAVVRIEAEQVRVEGQRVIDEGEQ